MTCGSRIKILRTHLGINQIEFAKQLKLTQSWITQIETGTVKLSEKIANSICLKFGVSKKWLMTGSGSMFIGDADERNCNSLKMENNALKREIELLKKILSLYESPKNKP